MAEKSSASGAAGRAPSASEPGRIRNVVLVGHSGAGKTALVEALLVATGTISRAGRVEDGTTVSDFDEAEARQQRSISLSLAPIEHDGVKVNLLDTPGYADFTGDLRAGLRAADAALFVVSAADGIDGTTRMIWDECATVGMPRAVVITQLDSPRADFEETLTTCQVAFGDGVLPLYLPLHGDDESVAGLIGLLSQQVFDYSSGTRVERDPDAEHLPLIESAHRNALIEAIIAESEDETLMDRYLGGEDIDLKVLIDDLETAVARGSFYPGARRLRRSGLGMAELLEVLVNGFPSPLEHPLPAGHPPRRLAGRAADLRSDGAAVRGGRQDDHRPVRRPDLAGPGLLRHPAARRRPPRVRARPRRPRARGPRRRREGRRAVLPARQDAAAGRLGDRRRHRRDREALARRDRRHPVDQGRPAAGRRVGDARAAAPGRDRREEQGRRGQALDRPATDRGRGADGPARAQRRDHAS